MGVRADRDRPGSRPDPTTPHGLPLGAAGSPFHAAPASLIAAKLRPPVARGLRRGRLDDLMQALWNHRLGLVIAPAGSGKTTLLAHVAAAAPAAIGWYRAEGTDDQLTLLAYIQTAVGAAGDHAWQTVEDAARGLEHRGGRRTLLVVDDVHCIAGTPAEGALARLIDYAPPGITFLLSSRHLPDLNVSRLRVAGEVLEVDADDLRFRTWEVERLFRDCYDDPLTPEELARVTHRTEGWAAGLQLFHLASHGKSHAERLRLITALSGRSRIVGEYLTRNVLDDLSEDLRDFLLRTSALGWMTPELCDALLDGPPAGSSAALLADLERRQIVTRASGERAAYRCHEVLRAHLEAVLVERVGEGAARDLFRRVGDLLEAAGRPTEALYAFCRGESWERAARLLGHDGEQIAGEPGSWMDLLPVPLVSRDPWLLTATARQCRAAGRWADAVDHYRRAEDAFQDAALAEECRRERQALQCWTEPTPVPPAAWFGMLRMAVRRNPLAAATPPPGDARSGFTAGLAALIAGHMDSARAQLSVVTRAEGATEHLAVAARLAEAIAGLLMGDARAERMLISAVEGAERLGTPWLAHLGMAALALLPRPESPSDAAASRLWFESRGDPWGTSLAALFDGLGALRRTGAAGRPALEAASRTFRDLGAGVLASWCDCTRALVLARAGDPSARSVATRAEATGRATGVRAPVALAALALARTDRAHSEEYRTMARGIAAECGIDLAAFAHPAPAAPASAPVTVRCLGRFSITIEGSPVDLAPVKPRVRQLLRLLALHAARPVHRETIVEALWPESDPDTGMRKLQVAVSSLRQVLPSPAGGSLVERDDDAYLLALPPDADVDFVTLGAAVAAGDSARTRGDPAAAASHYRRALDLCTGELLEEVGPADWAIAERERTKTNATRAALALGELLLAAGDPAGAAAACQKGLAIDRYRDTLWRRLIEALEWAEGPAAATVARARYTEMLAELGVPALAHRS